MHTVNMTYRHIHAHMQPTHTKIYIKFLSFKIETVQLWIFFSWMEVTYFSTFIYVLFSIHLYIYIFFFFI